MSIDMPAQPPRFRIAAALERIATALERQADADPLEVLGLALRDDAPQTRSDAPQPATATNGQIALYQHPAPGWEIVARRKTDAESGWIVTEERTV